MRLRVLLGAMTLPLALAGCSHTVTGAARVSPAGAAAGLRPADADRVLPATAEVSDTVGVKLQLDADRSRPITGPSPEPGCSALDAVGMAAFVGESWSRFRMLLFTDGDPHEQVIAEAVAVYPDAATAESVFGAALGAARACDGHQALGTGADSAWGFTVPGIDAGAVRWRKQQLGIPMTWVCHGEARLRSNAVLQVMACRTGDSGREAVTRLSDRMSASVWELAER